MAALPTTSLSISAVRTALSASSYVLSDLCKHANVNPWARYKPGYLEGDGTADKFVQYQPPQGASFTDPRGTNPDSGTALEVFRLGDFRGYDHAANAPYVSWPTTTHTFSSGTTTSFGISRTFYAEDINWANPGTVYREESNWAEMTHVHLLDAADDSIQGTAALPAIGGNVSITLDGVALTQGVLKTVTYHLAFGINSTTWAIKLGTRYGAGGIGDVKMLRLEPATISPVIFIDTSFTGGANDPYSSVTLVSTTNTNRLSGTTQAIWDYSNLDNWRCWYGGGPSDYDDYRNIQADWYIKGFHENPATEYQAKSAANFADNGANNTVDLSSMIDTPPHSTWEDGDDMILVLRNLTINF